MTQSSRSARSTKSVGSAPLWFKDAIIYEIPIRAFADSDGDGIGDINGLISKLDYLQGLGVTALWLLPFYPSPLRDGGYDISDYAAVHPMYGTLQDFKRLLRESHARGIRIITELVINHTSKEHPWFERARRSPAGSKWRNFYVWSDSDSAYAETRIIFRDFEVSNWTWDPVAGSFYWHRFYSHQPDLNFDNLDVHKAVLKALDFWLDLGVDGVRLDAVPYLYEREGTNCENLPETHQFLKKLRKHVDAKYADRMLLAEANQWPEDAAAYFGDGDECHMNFHFPLMPRMFMAVQLEDSFPIVDILRQTPEIPPNCQWATFLRNHDELTLEMVTDEDRDYMYKAYAQDPSARINLGIRRRLFPLLGTRPKVELLNGLLFSLPGTPVLYYGDEIGMGDNIYLGDRDGVRTPMQWTADRNAGFSQANPQRLHLPVITDPEYRYEAINVQAQENNSASLLWWMKRTIQLRKQHPALGSGRLEVLSPENPKVLAFLRILEADTVFVVANLSRFHQWVELDLSRFKGAAPVELSGQVRFPTIADEPYRLFLAPFGFLWFLLEPAAAQLASDSAPPSLTVRRTWTEVFTDHAGRPLAKALTAWSTQRRWYRDKARRNQSGAIIDVQYPKREPDHALVLLRIEFTTGDPQTYFLPLTVMRGEALSELEHNKPEAVIVHLNGLDEPTAVVDSLATGSAAKMLVAMITQRATARGKGKLSAFARGALKGRSPDSIPQPKAANFEQTNSAIILGDELLLKIYRQVEAGDNSELEIGEYLTKAGGAPVPKILGGLDYRGEVGDGAAALLVLVQEFVPNQGTAWELTTDRLGGFFDRVLSQGDTGLPISPARSEGAGTDLNAEQGFKELIGPYLSDVERLGRRTAEVHQALAGRKDLASFAPETFTTMHQQSLYQWTRALMVRTFAALRKKRQSLPAEVQKAATRVLGREPQIDAFLRRISTTRIDVRRIRCHGDLHLGQVLHTGDDFVIIDFEGEPGRPLNERSYKRCPLRDVMGMVRSFNYATETVLRSGRYREQDQDRLHQAARSWEALVTAAYVDAYLQAAKGAAFVPKNPDHAKLLLTFYGVEKAIYEIGYEMNNRPTWLPIPLAGLEALLERELSNDA